MRLKIVCVDDDVALLQMLKTSLAAVLSADVVGYPGAKDAVDRLAADTPPNILLVDYMMPGMDGLTFLGMVGALPGWDKTCLLMLSAVGSNIKSAALKQKVYAMIDKPVKPVFLAQTVSDLYRKFCNGDPSPLAIQLQEKAAAEAAKRLKPKR